MTSSQTSPPEPWFQSLIEQSLTAIYLLNLDGCPAADTVGKTARIWVRVLWNKPHGGWHQDTDTPRIRQAFSDIAETCVRWPQPAVFWDKLPRRPSPTKQAAAVGPDWGRERQREADQCMAAWLRDLGYTRAGDPIEAAP
jgi:hypothetical protein